MICLTCLGCETKSTIKEYEVCDKLALFPENYTAICKCVKRNKLTFPMKEVRTAKIFKNLNKGENGLFFKGKCFQADSKFLDSFRSFTADTSNFEWGELGTIYTDFLIEFYDSNYVLINKARVSYDGMVLISPELGTTKWGLLSMKGDDKIREIMNRYFSD